MKGHQDTWIVLVVFLVFAGFFWLGYWAVHVQANHHAKDRIVEVRKSEDHSITIHIDHATLQVQHMDQQPVMCVPANAPTGAKGK